MGDDELRALLEESLDRESALAQEMEAMKRQHSLAPPSTKTPVLWSVVQGVIGTLVLTTAGFMFKTYQTAHDLEATVLRDRQETEAAVTREAMRRAEEDEEHATNGHRDTNAELGAINRTLVKIDARLERLETRRR